MLSSSLIEPSRRLVPHCVVWLALTLAGSLGCERAPQASDGASRDRAVAAPSAPALPTASTQMQPRVAIPLGEFSAGTRPGSFPRDPVLEPRALRVKLGPFEIDRDLYPNQAGKPALLGVGREEASRRCGELDGRLCTELEWERACSGPEAHPFATGSEWVEPCGGDCTTSFGLLAMSSRPEWTGSDFGEGSPRRAQPVLRGPTTGAAPLHERRCAHRHAPSGEANQAVGFRCCYGPPNAERVGEPSDGPVFTKRQLDGKRLATLLESHPKTKHLAKDLTVFGEPESVNTVLDRGDHDRQGFSFTTSPLAWRPEVGVEFLVLTAKSGKDTSFVLVYHVAGTDDLELASSFVMRREKGPVVFAYSPSIRPRLHFSSCWGCPGENGKVLFRAPDSAVIVQP